MLQRELSTAAVHEVAALLAESRQVALAAVEELVVVPRCSRRDSLQVASVWVALAAASRAVLQAAVVQRAAMALVCRAVDVPFDLAVPCWAAAEDVPAKACRAPAGIADVLAVAHETRLP